MTYLVKVNRIVVDDCRLMTAAQLDGGVGGGDDLSKGARRD